MTQETTKAEAELLALVRLQGAQRFLLTVMTDGGQWLVKVEDSGSGVTAVGRGGSFEAAWSARAPAER